MHTHFYDRTLFQMLPDPVPECYIQLDDFYNSNCNNMYEAYDYYLSHASNICKRHSDILFYTNEISGLCLPGQNPFYAALIIPTFLVGYFSAVKSFTDGIAICLNEIHNLELKDIN